MLKICYLLPAILLTFGKSAKRFNQRYSIKDILKTAPLTFVFAMLWYPALIFYFTYVTMREMGFINDQLKLYKERNND